MSAAEPGPATDYSLRVWEMEDGLPHSSVAAMTQRRDGFLWIATLDGLVRFDGRQFVPVRSPLLADAKASSVRMVIEENATSLLALSTKSGLVRIQDRAVSVHPVMSHVEEGRLVVSLFREADDVFWLAFVDKELWRWDHGRIETFPALPGLKPYPRAVFASDGAGAVFVSRGWGIERFDEGRLRVVDTLESEPVALAGSMLGGVWIATSQAIHRLEGDVLRTVALPLDGPRAGSPASAMVETRDGSLWLALGSAGLWRWKAGELQAVPTSHAKINALLEDNEGNLWVATAGGGLNRLQRARFSLLADDPGWTTDMAGAVCEDAAGGIWFGNRNGLRRVVAGRVEVVSGRKGWPGRALPVAADADGRIWFAAGWRCYRASPEDAVPEVMLSGETVNVRAIFGAREGSVWIGREAGPVLRYRDGSWTRYGAESGMNEGAPVQAFAEDAHGRVWLGNAEGELFAIGPEGARRFGPQDGLPQSAIRALHCDERGVLWIGTGGGGMAVQMGSGFVTLDERHGLPDHVISQLLEDDFGALWFGSSRGIFKAQKSDLLACARGERSTVMPVRFGRSDGLPGVAAIGSYQPTAWKTRSGDLWFVTRKGLVRTNPREHDGARAVPPIYLERMTADERPVPASDLSAVPAARRIEFRFAAPAFADPDNVSFRYRLEGFDLDWSEPTQHRAVTYAALPPGQYRFRVTALHGDSGWNPNGASWAFVVQPRWWETWWALGMSASAAAVGLVAGARYWSHRRLRAKLSRLEQERRLEAERTRIARDLHDDLGASLTQVGMIAEELSEEEENATAIRTGANRLATRVRGLARDLEAVVWSVSPQNDRLPALCTYVCQFALEYFRQTPIRCRVHRPENIPDVRLSPEVRHHLFMIAKEAMNNALKHSGAETVWVSWQVGATEAELTVKDDGRGGAPTHGGKAGRNGLKNMEARAADMGAAMRISSGTTGTSVSVAMSLAAVATKRRAEADAS